MSGPIDASTMEQVFNAVRVLESGGVIAYPTEYCFGLGCDPRNEQAVDRLLAIKQRSKDQGVILISSDETQVQLLTDWDSIEPNRQTEIRASWPGPITWLLPAKTCVASWIRGKHSSVAMRVPDHLVSVELCKQFNFPVVSTSANRHGSPALLSARDVMSELGEELDLVLDLPVGGAESASTIRDAISGNYLR